MTEKEEKFNKIVANYPKSDFFSGKLCPDQYVGKIADFKNEDGEVKEDFPVRVNIFAGQTADVCIKFSSYEKIMILILESPHQEEFDDKGNPIGPANGTTGRKIRDHIAKIFQDKIKEIDKYHLILMNAIPFQCSLGFELTNSQENQNRRDDIFQKVWNNKNIGVKFFKDRLENLLANLPNDRKVKNVVIVNACTKGNLKEDLHCMVCKKIQAIFENNEFRFFHTAHPSSRHWNKNYRLNNLKRNPHCSCSNKRKCKESEIIKN